MQSIMKHLKLSRNIIIMWVLLRIQNARTLSCLSVKHADKKSMFEISDEINNLAVKARDGKLSGEEMKGGSMTISNLGSAGGQWFTPVINQPEVAILGIGRIEQKAIVRDGEIVAAPVLALSLSYDHRQIDGMTAQNALNHVKRLLNNPELLLMEG